MAFVFKESRKLDRLPKQTDETQGMDQDTLYRVERVIQKCLSQSPEQSHQSKFQRQSQIRFKFLTKPELQNQTRMHSFLKQIDRSNEEERIKKATNLQSISSGLKKKPFIQPFRTAFHDKEDSNKSTKFSELGPGSYDFQSTLKRNSLVRYTPKLVVAIEKKKNNDQESSEQQGSEDSQNQAEYSPGPGHYDPIDNKKVLCGVKYQTKKSVVLVSEDSSSEEVLIYQQSEKQQVRDQPPVKPDQKYMPSPNFRGLSIGNSHISDLLQKIVPSKSPSERTFRNLSLEDDDEEYQCLRDGSPGPGSYESLQRPRGLENLKNIFINKSPKNSFVLPRRLIVADRIKEPDALAEGGNHLKREIYGKRPANFRKQHSLPPFMFSKDRFGSSLLSQEAHHILQYTDENQIKKKINVFSKNYFGSHHKRFDISPAKLSPAPGDYNIESNVKRNPKNIYFQHDLERQTLFQSNTTPGPADYNLLPQPKSDCSSILCPKKRLKIHKHLLGKLSSMQKSNNQGIANLVLSSEQIFEHQKLMSLERQRIRGKNKLKNVMKSTLSSKGIEKQPETSRNCPFYAVDMEWDKKSYNKNFTSDYLRANNPVKIR